MAKDPYKPNRALEDEATRILKQARINAKSEQRAARRAEKTIGREEMRNAKREADRILKEAKDAVRQRGSSIRRNESTIKVTLTYIIANTLRALAIKECGSRTLQQVLRHTRLPGQARGGLFQRKTSIKIGINHYWASFYHDGFRGGTFNGHVSRSGKKPHQRWASSPRGFWLAFVQGGKCNGMDPRRPSRAIDEIKQTHYKRSFLRNQTPSFLRSVIRLRGQYMVFFRKRKSWPGDPFFTRAEQQLNDFLANQISKSAVPALLASAIDGLVGRAFGRQVRASDRLVRLSRFRDPYRLLNIEIDYVRTREISNIEGDVGSLAGGDAGLDFDSMSERLGPH